MSSTQTSPMEASPLLRLPNELLNTIMAHALSIGTIYVDLSPRRARTFRFVLDGSAQPLTRLLESLVCKKLHACYRLWPYTLNTFELYVAEIVPFVRHVPSEYLRLIREVRIERHLGWCLQYWDEGFAGLGMLDVLERVRLVATEGRDVSGAPGLLRSDLMELFGKEVDVRLEMVYPGNIEDEAVGRRRLFRNGGRG